MSIKDNFPSVLPNCERSGPSSTVDPLHRRLKYIRRGIYTIVYEISPPSVFCFNQTVDSMRGRCKSASSAARLIRELFMMAPHVFILHALGTLWTSFSSALGLYLSSILFFIIEESIKTGHLDERSLRILVLDWLFAAFVSVVMDRILYEAKGTLRGYLRARFLPQLVKSSFRRDVFSSRDSEVDLRLPHAWNFEDEEPGWEVIEHLSRKVRVTLTIALQILVLVLAISRKRSPDVEILTFFCVAYPLLQWTSPVNGAGGGAYVFWTENQHFKRLDALYHMAFSADYRKALLTDSMTRYVQEEFERSSEALGIVRDSGFSLAVNIPRAWYWDLLNDIIVELPLAVYALMLPSSFSPSSLTSMALLQQATNTIRGSIVECMLDQTSLAQIFAQAKGLYTAIEFQSDLCHGSSEYPDPCTSSDRGMRVSFRDVSLKYPGQVQDALRNVSLDILPGQLVVIVGVNGSGKSSMLSLLGRLFDPTSGHILIDDKPLISFDLSKLRDSMAFLSQTQEIYPLSIRENIQLGCSAGKDASQDKIDEAARLGGSYDWIIAQPRGFDTVLEPLNAIGSSVVGLGYEEISEALQNAREPHIERNISISGGEKQRLAASRTFMRLCNSPNIRLLVVDEPTSAIDPVAEHDLFSRFCGRRQGKTMIFVTHRFGHLVKHADLILCMDEGRIVETGTHKDLIDKDGEYAKLYNIQAAGYD